MYLKTKKILNKVNQVLIVWSLLTLPVCLRTALPPPLTPLPYSIPTAPKSMIIDNNYYNY